MPYEADLALALRLADAVDAVTLPGSLGDIAVEFKADDTPVTALDRAAERLVRDVLAAERLSTLPLTLLQKQVALFAAQGGLRTDCEDRFGVSQEALKKHLRTIYDVTGVANWTGLRERYWAQA